MGVIQRQGFKSSIVNYIGVAIGAVSTMYVYPKALEIVGLFRSMFDMAVLISILVLLGSSVSAVRFFPKYRDSDSGHNGLLSWLLIVSGAGFLIFLILFPFLHNWLATRIFDGDNAPYRSFLNFLIPLTLFVSLQSLLTRYISNFRRITIPAIFEQLTIKITLPLIILMYLAGWITVRGVVIGIVASFAFAAVGLILYLKYLGEWKLTKPVIWTDKPALKEYSEYSWYGLLSGVGSQVAFKIDSLMLSWMLQFQAVGIYSISLALSEIVIKPMRSLSTIAGPVLAHHIEHGNLEEVKSIYKKSSINMTVIGIGSFLLLWTVLPFLFRIMPRTEIMVQGTYVVFFLGLSQVWDMMTGVNQEIISYSKYYRFTLYLTIFLAAMNIAANFVFIRLYGVTGAALATCLSMFLFNVAKLIFIKIKFGFFPFSLRLIPVITFGAAAWLICLWVPVTGRAVVDLIVNGFLFSALYGMAIWKFKLSPDINQWVIRAWNRVRIHMFPPTQV